jgi:hypothetical protein
MWELKRTVNNLITVFGFLAPPAYQDFTTHNQSRGRQGLDGELGEILQPLILWLAGLV